MLVYGGFTIEDSGDRPVRPLADGAVLDLASGDWRALPAPPFEEPLLFASGVWTGAEAVIVGTPCAEATTEIYAALCEPGGVQAAAYAPATGAWRAIKDVEYGSDIVDSVDWVGLGWTGSEAVFQFPGPGPGVEPALLLLDPARGSSRRVSAPEAVDTVCVTGSGTVAVRTGQVLPGGGSLSPNPTALDQPIQTYLLDPRSLAWAELPNTPKPAAEGAMSEHVFCSAGELAYWPVLPAPAGFDGGGLWWDGARRRWEPVPGLGPAPPDAARLAAVRGARLIWRSGRLFLLQPGGSAWGEAKAPTGGPVKLSTLADLVLVAPTSSKPPDRQRIGLLDPERYVAAAG